MSLFLEEILQPLQEKGIDFEGSCKALAKVLQQIENRPLRSSERRLIQSQGMEFMKRHQMKIEQPLVAEFTKRLSFDFFPSVSALSLPTVSHNKKTPESDFPEREYGISSSNINLHEKPSSGIQFRCSIERTKSPLWTNYRFVVDSILQGDGRTLVKYSPPICIFGARKLKSPILYSVLVWTIPDSSLWKEKNSVGKIVKQTSIYLGRPHPDSTNASRGTDLGPPIIVSVSSRGIDKLIHIRAAAFTVPEGDMRDMRGAREAFEGTPDSVLFRAWDDRHGQIAPTKDVRGEGGGEGGGEALRKSAEARSGVGMENAVWLQSQYPRKQRKDGGTSSSLSPLLSLSADAAAASPPLHTVAFGRSFSCRVRAPSRKNIVLEGSVGRGTVDGCALGNGWAGGGGGDPLPRASHLGAGVAAVRAEAEPTPIWQFGKMADDSFAIDFHTITPFQAFVLALATFDQ